MNSASAMIKAALYYSTQLNLSVLPVGRNKVPIGSWEKYQTEKATQKEIMEWYIKTPDAQLGIVTGKLSGVFVVDVDSESALAEIEKYIPKTLKVPTVITPRGGRHFYFSYPKDTEIRNAIDLLKKVDIRGEGGLVVAPPSTNGNGKGWNWASGLKITEVDPPEPPDELLALILGKDLHVGTSLALKELNILNNNKRLSYKSSDLQTLTNLTAPYDILTEGRRDDDLFRAANLIIKGGGDPAFAYKLLMKLANTCTPPFSEEDAVLKVQSAIKRAAVRERKMTEEIRGWVSLQSGYFNLTDAFRDLQILTSTEKNAAYVAIKRLQEAGVIEKYGKKRGEYRLIEKDVEYLDFTEASTDEYDITLPLGLNEKCCIFPGNIIVVAGSKSAGKTALCLNIAKDNMRKKEVVYFSSEMGASEMRTRIEKFGLPLEDWKIKAIRRSSAWADLIDDGDKIFIIDYMEINQEKSYVVGDEIKAVFNKLRDGVCIIALQKNQGVDLARGGASSLDKARLYLSIDYIPEGQHSRMKIVDCKTPRSAVNPRGMFMDYKLTGGATYNPLTFWKFK